VIKIGLSDQHFVLAVHFKHRATFTHTN